MSVLPKDVALEMKHDIMTPQEGMFHKIYIQKHDHVRYEGGGGCGLSASSRYCCVLYETVLFCVL